MLVAQLVTSFTVTVVVWYAVRPLSHTSAVQLPTGTALERWIAQRDGEGAWGNDAEVRRANAMARGLRSARLRGCVALNARVCGVVASQGNVGAHAAEIAILQDRRVVDVVASRQGRARLGHWVGIKGGVAARGTERLVVQQLVVDDGELKVDVPIGATVDCRRLKM